MMTGITKNKKVVVQDDTDKKKEIKEIFIPSVDDLMGAGVHFGHKVSKRHPKMKEYIALSKNGIHIIDLEKTRIKLKEALEFLYGIVLKNGLVLFVGVKPIHREIIKNTANSCKMPYVVGRWLGGTLTNFKNIINRLKYFEDLKRKKADGSLSKYTKKEQVKFDKELEKMDLRFGGLEKLQRLPDVLFLCSINDNKAVIREAKRMKIPVVAVADTNSDPSLVDFPIPANDEAVSSLNFIGNLVARVIKKE